MASSLSSSSATAARSIPIYKKRWEGVHATPELRKLAESCWMQAQALKSSSNATNDSADVLSIDQAKAMLSQYQSQSSEEKETISIQVLRAIETILTATLSSPDNAANVLDQALTSTDLMFTPPPLTQSITEEQKRHRRRMEKLRLRCEETSYHRLTANIEHKVADDVTTRSMTYAASVGLNMIVAPLSFGCFAYFFAGQVFNWVAPEHEMQRRNNAHINHNAPDIRRVIAGVVGGVGMLFIEMILFVIRTHEFDKSIRQKDKRKTTNPFGPSAVPMEVSARPSPAELELTTMKPKSQ